MSANQQAAGDADRAQRVEAVCILGDLRLQRAGRDGGSVAVRLDGVINIVQLFLRIAGFRQEGDCGIGGQARTL